MLDKRGWPKYPKSKPKDNPDGLLEAELKAKEQAERGQTRKFKKRHLKDLHTAARKEIVRLYKEEHMLQRDIATYFKVSEALVGKLVRTAAQEKNMIEEKAKKEGGDDW